MAAALDVRLLCNICFVSRSILYSPLAIDYYSIHKIMIYRDQNRLNLYDLDVL